MTIRKATCHETEKIVSRSLEVLKESTMGYVLQEEGKALEMVSPFLSSGGYYLVYVENNVIEGWIGVGRTIDYNTNEMIGIIPEIYVLPKFRKQGIAESLCREANRQLKGKGYKKVQLTVYTGNHVKSLYQKLGFQEISTLMEINLDNL
ncbi:GNAT family N-acetyltransferase [Virgibacillus necropolis]|uniref:GNAT family N-acetyltransferase n=1 Tax=Virgibacillus necropolis TaxID=163877 RepID=A0A221MEI3_9BACI|nr:GNAT family N-acetyltransferase [Virgibacillus necropolis]ASN06051.1 GNAT family N-acetyltransferase [Virgibacillus necropolis]